jgi:hypothetical protein
MAGLGRKTWASGDTLTAADVNGYLMEQSVMVFAGTAARSSAIPAPSAGMVAYSTATALQVYNGTAWVDLSTGYGAATGGSSSSITVAGTAYTLLTFTASGTLTVTKSGLFDVLVLGAGGAGGGGSGTFSGFGGGGGGAGGLVQQTIYLSANTTVTVGAKGTGVGIDTAGTPGSKSAVDFVTAIGGGGGSGSGTTQNINTIQQGGSNGGGYRQQTAATLVLDSNQGNKGGNGATDAGGGGGGKGSVGSNAVTNTGGAGGSGYDVNAFTNAGSLFKAAGGGGGGSTAGGAGGSSIGGAGATGANASGVAASPANGAAGGGGSTGTGTSGAGSDGIVYVRFKV